eukprot:tig00020902_g14968.t1
MTCTRALPQGAVRVELLLEEGYANKGLPSEETGREAEAMEVTDPAQERRESAPDLQRHDRGKVAEAASKTAGVLSYPVVKPLRKLLRR